MSTTKRISAKEARETYNDLMSKETILNTIFDFIRARIKNGENSFTVSGYISNDLSLVRNQFNAIFDNPDLKKEIINELVKLGFTVEDHSTKFDITYSKTFKIIW